MGQVYDGLLPFEKTETNLGELPATETAMMVNIGSPAAAFQWWRLPSRGVGLARMEFIISNTIKIHPMALVRYDEIKDRSTRRQIEELTRSHADKRGYFVDALAHGIAKIAARVPSQSRYRSPERLQE